MLFSSTLTALPSVCMRGTGAVQTRYHEMCDMRVCVWLHGKFFFRVRGRLLFNVLRSNILLPVCLQGNLHMRLINNQMKAMNLPRKYLLAQLLQLMFAWKKTLFSASNLFSVGMGNPKLELSYTAKWTAAGGEWAEAMPPPGIFSVSSVSPTRLMSAAAEGGRREEPGRQHS